MINLREIRDRHLASGQWYLGSQLQEDIISMMKEACDKTVDLCVENAEMDFDHVETDDNTVTYYIDGNSILKTKDQIV